MRSWASMAKGRVRRCALAAAVAALAGAVPAQAATFVYVASPRSDEVFQFGLDPSGALSPLSAPSVAAGPNSNSVAVSPNGRSVYATNLDGVAQFNLGRGGLLVPMTPPTVAAGPSVDLAVSPDRRSVYVANILGTISQYDVGSDGRLSPKNPASIPLDRNPEVSRMPA